MSSSAPAGELKVDVSLYPNISELYRVEWRDVDAVVGGQRFRVIVYEDLLATDQPRFVTHYHRLIELEVDGVPRGRWSDGVDLPVERRDSVDECMHAGLSHVNDYAQPA
jgi:hypothetical protein